MILMIYLIIIEKKKNNENIDIEYKNLRRKMIEMSKIKSTFYNYFNYRPDKKISIKKTYNKKNNKKKIQQTQS